MATTCRLKTNSLNCYPDPKLCNDFTPAAIPIRKPHHLRSSKLLRPAASVGLLIKKDGNKTIGISFREYDSK